MKKKSLIAIGIIAVVALIGAGIFVVTRNNGNEDEVVTVQELPELDTQEIEAVESEPEVIEEVEEVKEEVKVEAESNGVSEDDEVEADEQESEESIVAVVEDDEEDEADEADKTDKAETTSTKTTETASTTNNTASNQNVDAATQAEVLEKAAANGFGFTNGTDGMATVEVENNGAGRDMSGQVVSVWE